MKTFNEWLGGDPDFEKMAKEKGFESANEMKKSYGKTMGYCPMCGEAGYMTERRINGNTHCFNGHVYPRKDVVRK